MKIKEHDEMVAYLTRKKTPTETKRQENTMERINRVKYEVGETKDYETEWTESKITRRILEWNGNEIIPKIETEEN